MKPFLNILLALVSLIVGVNLRIQLRCPSRSQPNHGSASDVAADSDTPSDRQTVNEDESTIQKLKATIENLSKEIEGYAKQKAESQPATATATMIKHSVCDSFGSSGTIPSALSLWMAHLNDTLRASTTDSLYTEVTADLLHLISPRLPLSTATSVQISQWPIINRVLDQAYRRYQYINDQTGTVKEVPPLRITVMGGSVTWGMHGYKFFREMKDRKARNQHKQFQCDWPTTLGRIFNPFLVSRTWFKSRILQHVGRIPIWERCCTKKIYYPMTPAIRTYLSTRTAQTTCTSVP